MVFKDKKNLFQQSIIGLCFPFHSRKGCQYSPPLKSIHFILHLIPLVFFKQNVLLSRKKFTPKSAQPYTMSRILLHLSFRIATKKTRRSQSINSSQREFNSFVISCSSGTWHIPVHLLVPFVCCAP